MQHPISKDNLQRFAAGTASREENRSVVAHLLKGCPACARILQEIERAETPVYAYDKVLDRFERGFRKERRIPSGRPALLSL